MGFKNTGETVHASIPWILQGWHLSISWCWGDGDTCPYFACTCLTTLFALTAFWLLKHSALPARWPPQWSREENAWSSQNWIGPIQYFSAEIDQRFSTDPIQTDYWSDCMLRASVLAFCWCVCLHKICTTKLIRKLGMLKKQMSTFELGSEVLLLCNQPWQLIWNFFDLRQPLHWPVIDTVCVCHSLSQSPSIAPSTHWCRSHWRYTRQ